MKKSVQIEIPDSILGEAKEKELKQIRREISQLTNKLRDAENKINHES